MSPFLQRASCCVAFSGLLLTAAACGPVRADAEPGKGPASTPVAAPKASDINPSAATEPKPQKDPYQVPPGGVPELLAFIKEVRAIQPTTREEMSAHRQKAPAALKAAVDKIQQIATPDDKKLPGYEDAIGMNLQFRAMDARAMSADERPKLVDDIKTFVKDATSPLAQLQAASGAMYLASGLERNDPPAAIALYNDLGSAFSQSQNPKLAAMGAKMVGAARRLALPGQFLEISGTQMDGSKFDWAKYRGEVVLVDFWATWCGPCMAELPNLKKNYELFHNKGFDVVGISLDEDRPALEAFLQKEQNPWITLHDGAWENNPVAQYYGIMGIPTVILVDKQGKVVSTQARGPKLGELLAELLGPPDAAAASRKSVK